MYSLYTCELFRHLSILGHQNEMSEMLPVQCFIHPFQMCKALKSNKQKKDTENLRFSISG